MEKQEKTSKKKRSVIVGAISSLLVNALIGVFILLALVGADHICPDYFKKEEEENDLSSLMFAHALVEYGRWAAFLLIIVMPVLMNIATYIICGFWVSVLFQIVLYFAITLRYY